MTEATPRWPLRTAAVVTDRTPDQLLRDASAIRHLLDRLDPDEHATRIRLVAAQDVVRLEAAQLWREHGWRPITDAVVVARRQRTLLLAPALAAGVAAVVAFRFLGANGALVTALALFSLVPLLLEWRGGTESLVRRWSGVGAVAIGWYQLTGEMPATLVFLPAGLLLAAIAVTGTSRRVPAVRWDERC